MGYTIKIVRELNIPVIIRYQSHTPDAKKKYLPSLSHLFSSFVCCCWGAHLRSRSFHYQYHLFPLLVVVL